VILFENSEYVCDVLSIKLFVVVTTLLLQVYVTSLD